MLKHKKLSAGDKMIEEKLREIEGLINQELCEYEVLSKLYDDKKQYLINSDFNNLSQTDSNIKKCVENINSLEENLLMKTWA